MGVLGAGGLALANTLAVTAEVLVLMVILRKRWGSVEGRLIGRTLLRAGLASAVMGLVIVAFLGRAEAAGLGSLPLVALGGLLGVFFMIPLRRYLIVQEHGRLSYPEGTACAAARQSASRNSGWSSAIRISGMPCSRLAAS